jgi:hypothetical protein
MDSNGSDQKSKRRKLPFCWIEKEKLRMIGDVFSGKQAGPAARSIYAALCEIASDKQSDSFDVSQSEIAHRALVSVASVKRILPVFRRLRLVKIQRNSINGIETRSTYTLVRGAASSHRASASSPTRNEVSYVRRISSKKASNGEARKRNTLVSNTQARSLADGNGGGFNPETGEYEWK